jgi:hypothetical protein
MKYQYSEKVIPLHAMRTLGGRVRYRSYFFLTSALEGGEWSASRPGRPLPPDKEPPVPTVQEAGLKAEAEGKSSVFVGDRTTFVQSVVTHDTELPGSLQYRKWR